MKQALLVIDLQQGLLAMNPLDYPRVQENIAALMKAAHAAGRLIVLVRHTEPFDGGLKEDSKEWMFDPFLENLPHDRIMNKTESSAFLQTDLDEFLKSRDVTHVLAMGMQTEYCIDATIKSGYERGFVMQVVADGVTTFDSPYLSAKQLNAHYVHAIYPNFAECKTAEQWISDFQQ
jgi:nicotinamidase-related amidase